MNCSEAAAESEKYTLEFWCNLRSLLGFYQPRRSCCDFARKPKLGWTKLESLGCFLASPPVMKLG
jgi:hypothetical protein